MKKSELDTRGRILAAAIKCFAHSGYAGTSVQEIVETAKLTKPALYYHFGSKAGLYQALMDMVHDERFRLIQEAVNRGGSIADQLTNTLAALFDYLIGHRDVMRLAFAMAFAAPGEVPQEIRVVEKAQRNFEFVQSLLAKAQAKGEIRPDISPEQLTRSFYGLMNMQVMLEVMKPGTQIADSNASRQRAGEVVDVFLHGTLSKAYKK